MSNTTSFTTYIEPDTTCYRQASDVSDAVPAKPNCHGELSAHHDTTCSSTYQIHAVRAAVRATCGTSIHFFFAFTEAVLPQP